MEKNKKIIVIGAGIAGISAAVELISRRYDVHIYESRNIIGGRAYSFKEYNTGEIIDNGQHIMLGAYKHTLELINKLGANDKISIWDSMEIDFIDRNGAKSKFKPLNLPFRLGVPLAFWKLRWIDNKSFFIFFRFLLNIRFNKIQSENISALEFLKKHKQNEILINNFWEPFILATMNNAPGNASAGLFVEIIKKVFLSEPDNYRVITPVNGLSDIFSVFPAYVCNRSSSNLFLSQSVTELVIEDDKITGIRLPDNEIIKADYVISTLPPDRTLEILPSLARQNNYFETLTQYDNSAIISIYLWFDRKINLSRMNALLGTKIQWAFNQDLLRKRDENITLKYPGLVSLTISNANMLLSYEHHDIIKFCLDELNYCLPDTRQAKLLQNLIIKDRRTTIFLTPEIANKRHCATTPIRNLVFAGDWTDTGLPATIESAAYSGVIAAKKIINLIKEA